MGDATKALLSAMSVMPVTLSPLLVLPRLGLIAASRWRRAVFQPSRAEPLANGSEPLASHSSRFVPSVFTDRYLTHCGGT